MNMANVSNTTTEIPPISFQWGECQGVIQVLTADYSIAFVAHSVTFDLLPSLLSSIFVFRFYHRIEIIHPLYAIVFMDIVISTVTSYLSFIFSIVNTVNILHFINRRNIN